MLLHMFALTLESLVFRSLSLSHSHHSTSCTGNWVIHVWQSKRSSCPVVRSTTGTIFRPTMRKFLLHCSTANERDGVRASGIQEPQTHHTLKILQSSMRWTICSQKFHTKGPIWDSSCSTTSLLKWCHKSSLRPYVKRPRYGDSFWEMGDPPFVLHVFLEQEIVVFGRVLKGFGDFNSRDSFVSRLMQHPPGDLRQRGTCGTMNLCL